MQPNNIRMIDCLEDKNLRYETLLQFLVKFSGDDLLYRHLRSMNPVPGVPDQRERTGADLPINKVVPYNPSPPRRLSHYSKSRGTLQPETAREPPRFKPANNKYQIL